MPGRDGPHSVITAAGRVRIEEGSAGGDDGPDAHEKTAEPVN